MTLSRAMAADLHGKYAEMRAMRVEHAEGREDVDQVRSRMNRLASRFPGALREIDRLELAEIERRIAQLHAFLQVSAEAEPWMAAVALFHSHARGALSAKRWLAGRRVVDVALLEAFAREAPHLPFANEIQGWGEDLATIASPPRGRLMDLVFARVAREIGTTVKGARQLVFGEPARRSAPSAPTVLPT